MSVAAITPSLSPADNRGGVYLGVLVGLLIPSLLAIGARTAVRIHFTKMWWDDYLMLIALPFLISNNALSIASIHNGIGRHQVFLPVEEAMLAGKFNTIAQPLNIWALFFVKASIVTLLLRMKPARLHIYVLWSTLGLLLLISVGVFVITMAQCQPLAKEWNPTLQGSCWPGAAFVDAAYVFAGCTILTDVVYITIPVIFLWNVQLKRSIKYSIWGVLGLGVLSMGCTIASIPFYHALSSTQDVTYEIVDLASIKTAEVNIAILTACAPPLQPFFKRIGEILRPASKPDTWESRQALAKRRLDYEILSHKGTEGGSQVALGDLSAPMSRTEYLSTDHPRKTTTLDSDRSIHIHKPVTDGNANLTRLQPPSETITKTTSFNLDYGRG